MNDIAFSVIINNDGIDDIIFKTIMVKGETGGAGIGIDHIEKTSTSGNVDAYTVYLEDGSVAGTFTVTNAILPETATIEDVEIASFSDGADDVPVSELIVDIEPVQAGSGEPSPTNVRPISGWSECNIYSLGANVWDEQIEGGDLYVTQDGSNHANANRMRSVNYIAVRPNETYNFVCPYSNAVIAFYGANKEYISNVQNVGWIPRPTDGTFTTPSWCYYIRFYFNATASTYYNDVCINYPATDTSYHAYKGGTETIDFGETTAFGGFLDVPNGKLTLDRDIVDLSDLDWNYGQSGNIYAFNTVLGANYEAYMPCICSAYTWQDIRYTNQLSDLHFHTYSQSNSTRIAIRNDSITDTSVFKTSMNGVKLVIPRATPQVIQLTPAQVRTVLNDNNIFADTGKIQKVVYFKTGCEALARLIDAFK